MADPPVLILDEATSSIDTRTEALVQQGMAFWQHRLPAFANMRTAQNKGVFCYVQKMLAFLLAMTLVCGESVATEVGSIMYASGTYCDLIAGGIVTYTGGFEKGVEDEVYIELNDLIDEYCPNYKALLDSDPDVNKNARTDSWMQKDGAVYYSPVEDGYRTYLEIMSSWYEEGLINPDFMSVGLGNTTNIVNGTAGVFCGQYNDCDTFTNMIDGANVLGMPEPRLNKGEELHVGQVNGRIGSSSKWVAISASCQTPELAAQWMDYAYSEEGELLNNYGIENETFVYNENGEPELTELITNNPDLSLTNAMWRYIDGNSGVRSYIWERELQTASDAAKACEDTWAHDGYADAGNHLVVDFEEGIYFGYRWYDHEGRTPMFPFGFGLSYTTFRLDNAALNREDGIKVSVDVTNTGNVVGDEIVQVYLGSCPVPDYVQIAEKQLCGFARVENVMPGETRRVEIAIDPRTFCYWDCKAELSTSTWGTKGKWVRTQGSRTLWIGDSSDHLPLSLTVD